MPRLDLTRQAAATGFALPADLGLTDADREAAIATWHGRMVNEHISARVFAGLVPQMMAAEVDASATAEVARMIGEELRHGVQCASVVHALGGTAIAELPPLPPVPLHPEVPPLEGFVRNILSVSCLSETVAVALIGRERLEHGLVILADEVGHARFGWRMLDDQVPKLDAAARERLGDYLITAFVHFRDHELLHLPEVAPPSARAEAIGVCDGRSARRLFTDTVERIIVPGLEKRGLPGGAAWRAAQAIPAHA